MWVIILCSNLLKENEVIQSNYSCIMTGLCLNAKLNFFRAFPSDFKGKLKPDQFLALDI